MKVVNFSLEQGNQYYGRIDGQRFYIGSRVSYEGGKGLANTKGSVDQKYDRALYRPSFGFWADFLHPTAVAESNRLFHTLNTYDRARFTFTFLQYAAHVPDGDFVGYFRALLGLPLAKAYFPDLTVQEGRICRITDAGLRVLEDRQSTAGLMDYFNPTLQQVEDVEIIQSAKLIHWVQNDPAHRQLQVSTGVAHFKRAMHQYANRYQLDGVSDRICLVVADIRHQGRAGSSAIQAALAASDPLAALLRIGEAKYTERIKTLRQELNRLTADGTLGRRAYRLDRADFV
jgi:hypothetical protein